MSKTPTPKRVRKVKASCPSPENPCFCDCHKNGDGTKWCINCLSGRHIEKSVAKSINAWAIIVNADKFVIPVLDAPRNAGVLYPLCVFSSEELAIKAFSIIGSMAKNIVTIVPVTITYQP